MKKICQRFSNFHLLALILFIFILIIRSYFALTHISFTQDQARDLFIIQDLIESGQYIVSYGPKTSIGDFTVFPFYYQLFLIFQLLADHPLTMYLVVTTIESLTPVILFFLLSLFFKQKIAWISSFLYSLFYLVITFSTSAWSPNLVPFFITTALYCWMVFLVKNKSIYLMFSVIALGIALHMHFQVLILMPFALIIFFMSLQRSLKNVKYWIFGALLAGITFLPYFITEINSGWPNTTSIIQFYTTEHTQYFDRVTKPEYVHSFFPGFMERVMFGKELPYLIFGRGLFFIGMFLFTLLAFKKKKIRYLLLYFFILFISLRMFKGDKHDYYLFPFFILPSVLISIIFEKLNKIYLPVTLILVFVLGYSFYRPQYNQINVVFSNTQELLNRLPENESVHIIFYDLDYANTYLYSFSQLGNLTLDRKAAILLEVCQNRRQCSKPSIPWCVNNHKQFIYASKIKWDNNYNEKEKIFTSSGMAARIGILEIEGEKIIPSTNAEMQTRKDLLETEIN